MSPVVAEVVWNQSLLNTLSLADRPTIANLPALLAFESSGGGVEEVGVKAGGGGGGASLAGDGGGLE